MERPLKINLDAANVPVVPKKKWTLKMRLRKTRQRAKGIFIDVRDSGDIAKKRHNQGAHRRAAMA